MTVLKEYNQADGISSAFFIAAPTSSLILNF